MKLTKEEKEMLNGRDGEAVKKGMEILTALGNIFGAEKLIPVNSVQISGVSFDNLGDAGLEFLNEMAEDGKVKVKTTLNPAGMDLENWEALGIPEEFAKKQKKVIEAFEKMGVQTTCTCTPYFVGNKPDLGDHVSWGESSAVTYANSVLGAFTNKEGGPSAIASALTGRTPEYGLHLEKNRKPNVLVKVSADLDKAFEFGALGKIIGEEQEGKIPYITGIKKASTEELKGFSAALPTFGGAPIFFMENISPGEAEKPKETMEVTREDMDAAIEEMNDGLEEVDFIFVGCPHCSLEELKKVAKILEGKKVKKELWIGVARPVKKKADELGISEIINKAGAKFACDTCHVVAPLKGRFDSIATNSGKGVFYGRGKNNFKTYFASFEKCVELAVK